MPLLERHAPLCGGALPQARENECIACTRGHLWYTPQEGAPGGTTSSSGDPGPGYKRGHHGIQDPRCLWHPYTRARATYGLEPLRCKSDFTSLSPPKSSGVGWKNDVQHSRGTWYVKHFNHFVQTCTRGHPRGVVLICSLRTCSGTTLHLLCIDGYMYYEYIVYGPFNIPQAVYYVLVPILVLRRPPKDDPRMTPFWDLVPGWVS